MRTRGGSSAIPRTMPRSVIVSTGISGSGIVSSTAMIAALSRVFSATAAMTEILHPFERERDSLTDADAHRRQREFSAGPLELLGRRQREPSAGHSERMAERDRAAVGVHLRRVIGKAELAKNCEPLRGEGLVQLDHVEVADLETKPLHQLLARGRRADAHDARRNASDGSTDHTRLGGEPVTLRRFFGRDNQRRGAIVYSGGVAGGDGAVGPDDRLQLGERFDARLARVLVLVDDDRIGLALRKLNRDDLGGQATIR